MSTPLLRNPAELTRSEARQRLFHSVFPPNSAASLPTPLATPNTSFAEPTPPTPTHGYNTRHHRQHSSPGNVPSPVTLLPSPAAVLARGSRAWHLATTFLSFPNAPFPQLFIQWRQSQRRPDHEELEAIRYLLLDNEDGNVDGRENLLEWYTCEVRRHFLDFVEPSCQIAHYPHLHPANELERLISKLTTAQDIYLHRFKEYLCITHEGGTSPRKLTRSRSRKREISVSNSDPRVRSFVRSLNTIISYSLPDPAWTELVKPVLLDYCKIAVGITGHRDDEDEEDEETDYTVDDDRDIYDMMPQSFNTETDLDGDIIVTNDEGDPIPVGRYDGLNDFTRFKQHPPDARFEARKKVLSLWASMEKLGVGGGGRRGERVFAEVINIIISTYIEEKFASKWESPSRAGKQLEEWIENVLGRLIADVLFSSAGKGDEVDARLDKMSPRESLRASRQSLDKRRRGGMDLDGPVGAIEEEAKRRREDLDTWKQIAIGRLGRLRVSELFDIVVDWPNSLGGVEDLKAYITTPQTRLHLTTTFTAALSQRILHPAAATTDILGAYIRLIRAFAVPDPRGVLLDRVSRGIRRYLRERDDTVRVIVRGFMAESIVDLDGEELTELVGELNKGIPALAAAMGGLEELDYDDMTWVPDPVDATPEFRRSKGLDVVGSLVSLWESKEVWIKEVQSVLSARLLYDPTYDFDREVRTVELIKLRFGTGATQALDVMLKDMSDSKRVDSVINEQMQLLADKPDVELHVKILSRFFWTNTLKKDSFRIPDSVQRVMGIYQRGFETLKKKRKLDWVPEHGTVAVELELQDRVIAVDDATTAQAAVIDTFNTDGHDLFTSTLDTVVRQLSMEPTMARAALAFWVDKGVLRERPAGVYSVIECVTDDDLTPEGVSPAHVPTEPQTLDLPVDEEKLQQRMVVQQFIVGMLTNGGPMPSDRIMMMLGMLVPGGFSWNHEELREFLTSMKDQGRLKIVGGAWAMA